MKKLLLTLTLTASTASIMASVRNKLQEDVMSAAWNNPPYFTINSRL